MSAVDAPRPDSVVTTVEHEEHLTFVVRQEPYTVHAAVIRRPPPDTATMALDIAMDSSTIDARISCGVPDVSGVRRASIDAVAPRWANARFGRVEQVAGVCDNVVIVHDRARRLVEFQRVLVGVGVTRTVKAWSAVMFIGMGVSLRL